jgi:hypothetical protein
MRQQRPQLLQMMFLLQELLLLLLLLVAAPTLLWLMHHMQQLLLKSCLGWLALAGRLLLCLVLHMLRLQVVAAGLRFAPFLVPSYAICACK